MGNPYTYTELGNKRKYDANEKIPNNTGIPETGTSFHEWYHNNENGVIIKKASNIYNI
tara:strand:- start:9201 stop:9374 length:174 start_codon:yes stop_codon:yes gene_type:complete